MEQYAAKFLVRQVQEYLEAPSDEKYGEQLAVQYSEAWQAASRHLQQCGTEEDANHLLQLAEDQAWFLGLIEVLDFPSAERWRQVCVDKGFIVPAAIDPGAVTQLNARFANGLNNDHPLYVKYREAIYRRQDREALRILRIITRLNPKDQTAAEEELRLDAKVLKEQLDELADLLRQKQTASIRQKVEQIEQLGFQTSPASSAWSEAQVVLCECLVEETADLQVKGDWRTAKSFLRRVNQLVNEWKIQLPGLVGVNLLMASKWAAKEEYAERKALEFTQAQKELWQQIFHSEEKDSRLRHVALVELKQDFETLCRLGRQLEGFRMRIPGDLAARLHKRRNLMEAQIRRASRRKQLTLAGAWLFLAAVVVAAFMSYLIYGWAKDLEKQLESAIQDRRVADIESLTKKSQQGGVWYFPMSGLRAIEALALNTLHEERQKLDNFLKAMSRLPAQYPDTVSSQWLARITVQFAELTNLYNILAPDYRLAQKASFETQEMNWSNLLAKQEGFINHKLETLVAAIELRGRQMDFALGLPAGQNALTEASALHAELSALQEGFGSCLRLKPELIQRHKAAKAGIVAYKTEADALIKAREKLSQAADSVAYQQALSEMAASQFKNEPDCRAADLLKSVSHDGDTFLRVLLFANNSTAAKHFSESNNDIFMPAAAMPAEKRWHSDLCSSPGIHPDFGRYIVEGKVWITKGKLTSHNMWQDVAVYFPEQSPTRYSLTMMEYGFFDGVLRVSQLNGITRSINLPPKFESCQETAAFYTLEMEKLVDYNTEKYRLPFLKLMDALKNNREGSSLFRAWLLTKILQVMELRPEESGLTVAPLARIHAAELMRLGVGDLRDGDWFAPSQVSKFKPSFDRFFDSIASLSYWEQASKQAALIRTTMDNGFIFAGYVSLVAEPVFTSASNQSEFWGISNETKQPVLLCRVVNGQIKVLCSPLPMSPLFTLGKNRSSLLKAAGIGEKDPLFQKMLPPLFTNTFYE